MTQAFCVKLWSDVAWSAKRRVVENYSVWSERGKQGEKQEKDHRTRMKTQTLCDQESPARSLKERRKV